LIISNAILIWIVATWFIHFMPSPPISTVHAMDLYSAGSMGFVFGVLVLTGAIISRHQQTNRKAWGTMMIIFSVLGYITDGGFHVGSILGIVDGVSTIRRKNKTQ
jgi:hypothetical protein